MIDAADPSNEYRHLFEFVIVVGVQKGIRHDLLYCILVHFKGYPTLPFDVFYVYVQKGCAQQDNVCIFI